MSNAKSHAITIHAKNPAAPAVRREAENASISASMRAWLSRSGFTSAVIPFLSFLYLRP
jgi:hypothetical protein